MRPLYVPHTDPGMVDTKSKSCLYRWLRPEQHSAIFAHWRVFPTVWLQITRRGVVGEPHRKSAPVLDTMDRLNPRQRHDLYRPLKVTAGGLRIRDNSAKVAMMAAIAASAVSIAPLRATDNQRARGSASGKTSSGSGTGTWHTNRDVMRICCLLEANQ